MTGNNRVSAPALRWLDATSIHTPELCTGIGVSAACCGAAKSTSGWDQLATSGCGACIWPAAHSPSEPSSTTVTEIATAHGFWELGPLCSRLSDAVRRATIYGSAAAPTNKKTTGGTIRSVHVSANA
jgi:hypothetical protein